MRTKPCESVVTCDVTDWEPRPFVYLEYDGLAGISQRPMLRDLAEELERKGEWQKFVEHLRRQRVKTADIMVYFHDYDSYGVGGGDASSEKFFRTHLVVWWPADPTKGIPEHLSVERTEGIERLSLEQAA
jgi:hypothetical protein